MKGIRRVLILVTILALFLAGCGREPVEVITPQPPDREDPIETVDPPLNTPPTGDRDVEGSFAITTVIHGIQGDNLGYPIAAYQDEAGNTYVLDLYSTDGLVKVFDPQGKYLSKYISLQSPESQPVNLTVDSRGHVYIADLGLGAVQRFVQGELVETLQPGENFYPRSLAVDSIGNLWVMSFDRVYKITPEGEISYFGESGNEEGQFGTAGSEFYIGPTDLCIDERDYLYVADTLNRRVQKFDAQGNFLAQFPLEVNPQGIWVNSQGDIYVASAEGIIKLDSRGEYQRDIPIAGWDYRELSHFSISGGENQTLLVAIPERHQVKVYSEDLEVYTLKGNTDVGFIYPHHVEAHGQQVAIVAGDPFYRDEMNHRAMLYDDEGKFIAHLLTDFGIGSFLSPKSAAHLGGRWYVLDLDIISAFNSRGQFITSFGGRGRGPGDFGVYDNFGQEEGPAAMVSSKFGHLLVSDTYNHRIQLIDKDGRFKGAFEADRPGALCEDANGNIYVVSPHRGVVTKYSSTGEKLLEFGKPGSGEGEFTRENLEGITFGPSGIAVHPKTGLVYVSDTEAHRIQVFDPQGDFLKVLGGFGATEKGFFNPGGLAFDEEGYLWVADTGNHRVIQLDVK